MPTCGESSEEGAAACRTSVYGCSHGRKVGMTEKSEVEENLNHII